MALFEDHPILSGLGLVVTFAVGTFPVWLGSVWPLFSKKTLPEWVREQRWPILSQSANVITKWILGVIVVGLFLALIFARPQRQWSSAMEPIVGREYMNEKVEIDGKNFRNCSFTNVTLMFNGRASYGFDGCRFTGSTALATGDPAIRAYSAGAQMLRAITGDNADFTTRDDLGRITPILPKELDKRQSGKK